MKLLLLNLYLDSFDTKGIYLKYSFAFKEFYMSFSSLDIPKKTITVKLKKL